MRRPKSVSNATAKLRLLSESGVQSISNSSKRPFSITKSNSRVCSRAIDRLPMSASCFDTRTLYWNAFSSKKVGILVLT
jgi:hypothetical protein